MIRKRYRVSVDVDVEVEEVTIERAEAHAAERIAAYLASEHQWDNGPAKPSLADVDACRALQAELLNDPTLLDEWLRQVAMGDVANEIEDAVDAVRSETRALKPAIERLRPDFQQWWEETLTDFDKIDRIETFYQGLRTTMGPVEVAEIERPVP